MPLTPVVTPPYPNVPVASGVPAVLRTINYVEATIVLVVADAQLLAAAFSGTQWGIFDDKGVLVLEPDSIASVDFRKEFKNSTFPVEEGGFGTYNKVGSPSDVRISMTIGGSEDDRANFLFKVDNLVSNLNLYNVSTPEALYIHMNLMHYDYRRTRQGGAYLLIVDVWLEEIRVVNANIFIAAQDPSGTPPTNSGQVQGTDVSPSNGPVTPAQQAIRGNDASFRTASPTVLT